MNHDFIARCCAREQLGGFVVHVADLDVHLVHAIAVDHEDIPPAAVSKQRADRDLQALAALPDGHLGEDAIAMSESGVRFRQIQDRVDALLLDPER